jgi:hypothetical protein
MEKLKLPECDLKIKNEEGNEYVFDIIRKKYVMLTPEEWVRQHFIHLMVDHLGYPKSLIKLETGHNYFKSAKRSDIILLNRDAEPFLLIECKAPSISLTKSVVNQAAIYNKTLNAQFLAVTNGIKSFIWELENGEYIVRKHFPSFPSPDLL